MPESYCDDALPPTGQKISLHPITKRDSTFSADHHWVIRHSAAGSQLQCSWMRMPEWQNMLHLFYFLRDKTKILFTIIFTDMRALMTIFSSDSSVQACLFQAGVVCCCFTLTWRSAWSFFRGSFGQVIQLDRWGWLLEERKKGTFNIESAESNFSLT